MTDDYGIHPMGDVDSAFAWRHSSLDEARAVAQRIAHEHRIEVIVFKIIGTYAPSTTWRKSEGNDHD